MGKDVKVTTSVSVFYAKLALSVACIACLTVFAIQNAGVTTVRIFLWDFEFSLALVVLLAVMLGIIIGASLGVWFRWHRTHLGNRPRRKQSAESDPG